ncbi:hypothetical protein [Empedobacter brevis]|uniref:hypothetical protein n=1 Tax=Empedobacter brevis TaxID=247 RepID=UPI0039AED24A
MKINQIFTILFIVLFSIYTKAQETKFSINKPFKEVVSLVSNFNNDFTPTDRIGEAVASENEFKTTISLEKLKVDKDSEYFSLAYKKPSEEMQFIKEAKWEVSINGNPNNSTEVKVKLSSIEPDIESKKIIDTKKSKSTGKLEEEIKTYLTNNNYTINESTDSLVSDYSEEFDISDIPDQFEFKELEKLESKILKKLFKNDFIKLPANKEYFTKIIGTDPKELYCEACKDDKYWSWDFDDFNLIYGFMKDSKPFYAIQYYGEDAVSGLPFNVVFNETSMTECKNIFARYNAQWYQNVGDEESDNTAKFNVEFKKGNDNIQFEFINQSLKRLLVYKE